jgi:hypothetical protein
MKLLPESAQVPSQYHFPRVLTSLFSFSSDVRRQRPRSRQNALLRPSFRTIPSRSPKTTSNCKHLLWDVPEQLTRRRLQHHATVIQHTLAKLVSTLLHFVSCQFSFEPIFPCSPQPFVSATSPCTVHAYSRLLVGLFGTFTILPYHTFLRAFSGQSRGDISTFAM